MDQSLVNVLPPNSTALERSLAEVMDARAPLAPQIPRLGTIGVTEFPADWLPWLVIHYGLDRIAPYVGDLLKTLKEGRAWQRVRGTPSATEDFVLDWLGLEGLEVPDGYGGAGPVEEERVGDVKWWMYQIALAAAPDALDVIVRLIGADDLSRNAGTVLGRIYGGYDVRPMRLDMMRLDGALLDDWSGVFLDGIAPKLSFGRLHGVEIDFHADVAGGSDGLISGTARFEEGFVLDRSQLDGEVLEPSVIAIQASLSGETINLGKDVMMPWPHGRWPLAAWSQFEPFAIYGGPDGTSG
jgi:hypothetical protein